MTVTYLLGEEVQFGVGPETVRGTAVTPTVWMPGRKPASMQMNLETVKLKETRGSGMTTEGSEITSTGAGGDFEFNIRNTAIGYILRSLLGSSSAVTALGATTHTFERLTTSPQNPSLTLALAQPGQQHYAYALSIADELSVNVTLNELVNATAKFQSGSEATHVDYTPAFSEINDNIFRPQDVTIKFAANIAGLATATAISIKELKFTINGNTKPHQTIGSLAYSDVFTGPMEITGSFSADYTGAATYYTAFTANTSQAMGIYFERDDLPVLGTSALYPKMSFEFPKVNFANYKPDRPIDDIVHEGVDFIAHFDSTLAYAVKAYLQNVKTNYTT